VDGVSGWRTALADGVGRVGRAPAILAGVWLATAAVSLPLAAAMRGQLAQHLGASLAADSALAGSNYVWMQEFAAQATGIGVTFKPTIIGFGAVLDNLSALLDDLSRPVAIVAGAAAYAVIWLLLAGGIIDRYARDRATRSSGFFAAAGTFFFRFLRLGAVMWAVYAVLFAYVHRWMFGPVWNGLTRDITEERTAFAIRAALYAAFGLLLCGCNLLFDYAKVRAVVEDRRSMLGAIAAAARFLRQNPGPAVALYAADAALWILVVALYALAAPGVGGARWEPGFAVGQLYVAARLWTKLVFWASETALFQRRLAHAGYIAAPQPVWPESPAAEAIARSAS
jgi:hypothetical protein